MTTTTTSLLLFTTAALLACGTDPAPADECTLDDDCAGEACVDGRCTPRPDAGSGTDAGDADDGGRREVDAGPPLDGGPICVPTEEPEVSCNALDDDCNGLVDDVDLAGDGICDCLVIGVIGEAGTRASSSFQAWLEARGTTVTRFGLDDTELQAEQLAELDVVILDRLMRSYTAEEAARLLAFVEAGGGVMVMTGYTGADVDRDRPGSLLAPFGIRYAPGLLSGPVTTWTDHPIAEGLASVTFAGGFLVEVVPGVDGGTNTPVARLSDGLAGLAQERGEGRVFVWGDEWIQFDSEWSTMPMITQLWVNTLAWLGPRDRCQTLI